MYEQKVAVYDYAMPEGFNERLVQSCENTLPRTTKHRTDLAAIEDQETIVELQKVLTESFYKYCEEFYDKSLLEDYEAFQELILIKHRNGESLAVHCHLESFVTMTYYPQDLPEKTSETLRGMNKKYQSGDLAFHDPSGSSHWDKYAKNPSPHSTVTPKAGRVVVFSGKMPHFTVPGASEERLCCTAFVALVSKASKKIHKVGE